MVLGFATGAGGMWRWRHDGVGGFCGSVVSERWWKVVVGSRLFLASRRLVILTLNEYRRSCH